ncbi:hypothetical protein TNCV_3416631 [Trichonephila clavipes]|nr:hypothetical protein TNCV_3416631 [Trichonephila clavipes]
MPLQHGGTLNSRRAASPLMRLVEGEERWEAPDSLGCFPSKLGWNQAKKTVLSPIWCLRLRPKTGVPLEVQPVSGSGKKNNNLSFPSRRTRQQQQHSESSHDFRHSSVNNY